MISEEIREIRLSRPKLWTSGNAVGIILCTMATPALEKMTAICSLHRTNHELLLLQIAMQRYHLANGNWPESLEELVPKFIDAVPVDQIDGQPLRYNPDTRIIYSIGTDFVDSDGETRPNRNGPFDDREESAISLEAP